MIRTLALALALSGATVYTGDGPPLADATILIEGERIVAVGRDVAIPAGAERLDLRGRRVTPGLVDAVSRLGLVEVSAEPSTVGATLGPDADPVRAALRVEDSFDPRSETLAVARTGGLTSAVAVPVGGLVSGLSAAIELGASPRVAHAPVALHVRIGAGEPGARSAAFLRLRELLGDARLYRGNRGSFISRRLRELSAGPLDLPVLARATSGELPVVFHVDRAADISTVLRIAGDGKLRAIIAGGAEAWMVAAELAAAGVPVVLDPLANLPVDFDALHSTSRSAALLRERGVRVALSTLGEAHRAHRLRLAAGNAVAAGLDRDAALAAITRVPAEILGLDGIGVLRPGARADLVIWNGDPLEPGTWAEQVLVRGEPVSLRTRQDALVERYGTAAPLTTPP